MKLSQFSISQLIFEIRYAEAYELWDAAGALHRDLVKIWPGAKLVEGKPNQQVLRSDFVQITSGFKNSNLVLFSPTSILQKSEGVAETFKLWCQHIKVTQLERVGTRVLFRRKFGSEGEACAAALALPLYHGPRHLFGHASNPVSSDIKLGWRDETVGSSLSIRTETRTLEVQAEPDFKEQSRRIETHELVVDFDRYTAKPLQLEQFRAVEWLSGFNRLISKDLTSLLEADENTR